MYYKPCTCIPTCGFRSQPEEDKLNWCQSVVNYVKETRANKLELQTVPSYGVFWQLIDIQPLFDSLLNSEITDINLRGKNLTGKFQNLCEILSKTKIEKLNLASCSLTVDDVMSLMAVLKDTRISELDISSNSTRFEKTQQIKKFIAHIVNSRLRSLNLSFNGILPVEKLPALFQRLPDTKITHLDLSSFFFRCGYPYGKKYPGCLDTLMSYLQHTAITDLNLRENELGDDIAKALAPVLGKSKLEKLNLSYNKLTDAGIDLLVPGLINSRITYLNLLNNKIEGNNSLGHSLKETKIKTLDLTGNPINKRKIFSGSDFLQGSDINTLSFRGCFFFNKTIPLHIKKLKFSELTCLDLSGNRLGLEDVSALAFVLSSSKITHLILSGNRMSEESFVVLGDCLIKSQLKYINLSATAQYIGRKTKPIVGNRGIAQLMEKSKGSRIVSMNLSDNYLGEDEDCITPTLANSALLELDLSRNRWIKGIDRLAEQLKFTSLTALHLYLNGFEKSGAVALSKCLEETQIVVLTLRSNSITNNGVKALAEVLTKTKLRYLDLSSNQIENDGLEMLAENAKSTCITYLNVDRSRGNRTLMVDSVVWENRRKILVFADLLKKTSLFTGDSFFEYDSIFDRVDIEAFVEDCLKLYKMVIDAPYIVTSIEQDKRIADLNSVKRFEYDTHSYDDVRVVVDIFIEDCSRIYEKVLKQPSPIQNTGEEDANVSFFKKQMLWLMLEEFPRKFVTFIQKTLGADVEKHLSLLRKIDELDLTRLVELLLSNRSMYTIDQSSEILHPFVYKLLSKHKQIICNLEAEPDGVEKIIEYFIDHLDLDGASEIVSLLRDSLST